MQRPETYWVRFEERPRKNPNEAARYRSSSPRRLCLSSSTTTTRFRCSFVFAFHLRGPSSRRSSPRPTRPPAPRPRPRRGPRTRRTRTPPRAHEASTSRGRPPDVAPPRRVSSHSRPRALGNRARGRRGVARRLEARRPPRRARARGVQRTPPSRVRRGERCGRPLLPRVTLCAHSPLPLGAEEKSARVGKSFFRFALPGEARFAEFIHPDPRRKINIAERGRRTRSKFSDCPRVKKIESRPRLPPTRQDLANRKLSNSNSGELRCRLVLVACPIFCLSALEREEERAAELAERHKHTRSARGSAPRPRATSEGRFIPGPFAVVTRRRRSNPRAATTEPRDLARVALRRKKRRRRFSSRVDESARVPCAGDGRATRTAATRD